MKRERLLELTVLALLGTLMFGLKLSMAGLPNIEPVSLLILVYTAVFGRKTLYAVYTYVLLEFLLFGVGLWSLNYLYVWPILYLLGRLFRKMESPWGWAILSGAFGLCFGLLCAPVYCVTGGFFFGLSWWISGIPFDALHCAGNFCLTLTLYRPLTRGLLALKARYLPEHNA